MLAIGEWLNVSEDRRCVRVNISTCNLQACIFRCCSKMWARGPPFGLSLKLDCRVHCFRHWRYTLLGFLLLVLPFTFTGHSTLHRPPLEWGRRNVVYFDSGCSPLCVCLSSSTNLLSTVISSFSLVACTVMVHWRQTSPMSIVKNLEKCWATAMLLLSQSSLRWSVCAFSRGVRDHNHVSNLGK